MIEPRVSYVTARDGVRIAWTTLGSGPTLILMPPVPFSDFVAEWRIPRLRDVFHRLAAEFRLVQFDGRGTGHSQRDVPDLSFEAMLRDVDAVVEEAGLDRFALLGSYNSCATAIAYAARHPTRVSRLALFGGSARGWDAMAGRETQAVLSLIERDWDVFVDSAAVAWLGWSDGVQGKLGADWFRGSTTPMVARETLQAISAVDLTDELGSVDAPVLVLHRRHSRQIPLETSASLAAALPLGELRILEGSTATLFFDDPDTVVEALLNFFGGDGTPTGSPTVAHRPDGLTPRELEVLRLIAGGETNAEIAHRLSVSVHTVERHAVNLYAKIGARGRADATAYALRNGLG